MMVKIVRLERKNDCIVGNLLIDDEIFCVTLELPYKNNLKWVSSIPSGNYKCRLTKSSKYDNVYEITDVPNRTNILLHIGNSVSDIAGCILLGERVGYWGKKRVILNSTVTFVDFMYRLDGIDGFDLTIIDFF